jgi:serine protease AprX
MAAAEVSGIAALIVQAHPTLTNDEVKYRLMATARPARDAQTGQFLYSPWEQGAGLVDAPAAVLGEITGTANNGLDVIQDLTTNTHYWGYTSWDPATGQFSLPVEDSTTRVWEGSLATTWAGNAALWAGSNRAWAAAAPSAALTAATAQILLNEP